MFINGTPKNPSSHLAFFADDTALYARSNRLLNLRNTFFKKHLDVEHFNALKLTVKPAKTQAIIFF